MPKNLLTDLFAYAKIALGGLFVYYKLTHGQEFTAPDYILLGALGLGAGGSKVSADAKKDAP